MNKSAYSLMEFKVHFRGNTCTLKLQCKVKYEKCFRGRTKKIPKAFEWRVILSGLINVVLVEVIFGLDLIE